MVQVTPPLTPSGEDAACPSQASTPTLRHKGRLPTAAARLDVWVAWQGTPSAGLRIKLPQVVQAALGAAACSIKHSCNAVGKCRPTAGERLDWSHTLHASHDVTHIAVLGPR